MRWFVALSIVLVAGLPVRAEDWTTADGKTYKDVTILNQEDDGVRITYTGGVGKIPYYELPVEIQKRYGQDIDSLAAKRAAINKAAEDAVGNAAAAEDLKQQYDLVAAEVQKKQPAGNGAQAQPAGATPNGPSSATASAQTQAQQPGATPNGPSSAAASAQAQGQPAGVTPNGPSSATASVQTQVQRPGAPPNGPSPATASAQTQAQQAASQNVPSSAPPAQVQAAPIPGAKVSYSDALDVSYLDSPVVDVWPEPAPAVPNPPGQGTTLSLRIVTEGRQPQAPKKIEATFLYANPLKKLPGNRDVVFSVDGAALPITEEAKKGNGFLTNAGQAAEYVSFYLTPAQAKMIVQGTNVLFTVGSSNFRIDEDGLSTLRKYLGEVEKLPPATSSIVRMFFKFLARLPSLVSIISTICEYIILGGFSILVAAAIAAFVMGMSRFIKM